MDGTEPRHEPSDVSVGAVLAAGVALLVAAVVIQGALWFHFQSLAARESASDRPPSPLAAALPERPPEPRLQTAALADLRQVHAAEDAVLGGYGWVDRKAGVVRIPIQRAKELFAGRPR